MTVDRETWYRVPRSAEECAVHLEAGGVVEINDDGRWRQTTAGARSFREATPEGFGQDEYRLVYSSPVGMSPVIGAPGQVAFTRSEVLQLLGRWGLPPWTDHDGTQLGGKVDCAALAEQIAASVDGWCHACHAEREASGWTDSLCGKHRESVSPDAPAPDDLLYDAWGLIANACGGDWDAADKLATGWKAAAERWREGWHASIEARPPAPEPRTEMVPLTKLVGRTLVGETSPVRSVDAVLGNGDLAVIAVTDSPCGPLVEVLAEEEA